MKRTAMALWIAASFGVYGAVAKAQHASSTEGKSSSEAVEARRSEAKQQTEATIDREAVSAINETENALKAIKNKNKKEALAALERATGKVDILVARNAKAALVPVEFAVEVADTAPADTKAIDRLADASRDALRDRKFADARTTLDMLRSEVRVRTFNLPLASYPMALAKAAKLVDDGKYDESATVLRAALNTLVILDRATSIPMMELTDSLKKADEAAQ